MTRISIRYQEFTAVGQILQPRPPSRDEARNEEHFVKRQRGTKQLSLVLNEDEAERLIFNVS